MVARLCLVILALTPIADQLDSHNAKIARAFTVVIDDSTSLEDQFVALGHAGMPLL